MGTYTKNILKLHAYGMDSYSAVHRLQYEWAGKIAQRALKTKSYTQHLRLACCYFKVICQNFKWLLLELLLFLRIWHVSFKEKHVLLMYQFNGEEVVEGARKEGENEKKSLGAMGKCLCGENCKCLQTIPSLYRYRGVGCRIGQMYLSG